MSLKLHCLRNAWPGCCLMRPSCCLADCACIVATWLLRGHPVTIWPRQTFSFHPFEVQRTETHHHKPVDENTYANMSTLNLLRAQPKHKQVSLQH